MTRMALSGRSDLENALRMIDESLTREVTAYLIGGCAMMLYDAKTATKDVDLVLLSVEEAKSVVDALSRSGFRRTEPDSDAYRALGTTTIMENDRGMRIDIFVETVCRKLRVSDGMIARSTPHDTYERIHIRLISPEDIFLFKSMTERTGDLDDMALLAERGLDWMAILGECAAQSGERIIEGYLAVRLQELEKERGVVSPILKDLEEITERRLGSMGLH